MKVQKYCQDHFGWSKEMYAAVTLSLMGAGDATPAELDAFVATGQLPDAVKDRPLPTARELFKRAYHKFDHNLMLTVQRYCEVIYGWTPEEYADFVASLGMDTAEQYTHAMTGELPEDIQARVAGLAKGWIFKMARSWYRHEMRYIDYNYGWR